MDSDDFEAPETSGEPDLAASLGSQERSRRLRLFAVRVDSHASLLNAIRRLRRQLPGDEQFGDPLSTAGVQPVEVLGRTVSALHAALDAQTEVGKIAIAGYRPSMRVGVHWGSPRKLGGDYLGVDVNIAARVGDAAKPARCLSPTRCRRGSARAT